MFIQYIFGSLPPCNSGKKRELYQHRPPGSKKQFLCYQCRERWNVCKKVKMHQKNARKHQAVLYILYCFDPAILKCTRFPHHWQQCVRMIPNVDGRLSTKVEHHPWHPTIAPYHGTLHSNGVQKKHPLAPCNGTRSTPPMAPGPLPQSWSSPSPPNHSTLLQWHPAPRPIRQSGSSPCPPIGSKNPYS